MVALEPRDGAIVSLVGGFDFNESKYNRVVQAQRQPGSAFKPFLYSAALERGFTPATLVNDAPIVMPGGGGADGDEEWRPQNITRKFYGPTPMREGLVRSRNLVSIRLLRGTGLVPAMRHIENFGFKPSALPPNLTLALGTGQTTPLDMARGFAVFANGGFKRDALFHRIDAGRERRATCSRRTVARVPGVRADWQRTPRRRRQVPRRRTRRAVSTRTADATVSGLTNGAEAAVALDTAAPAE